MSYYRMTLRFNLEDETEGKTAAFLKALDCTEHKSKNRFVIELIAAYMDSLSKETQEDAFLEKIRLMFREEIAEISVVTTTPATEPTPAAFSTELTEEEKEENAAGALAALEMFG